MKIFNGKYTRLDDDTSFQLVRTNPLLTTNTKLMYDGERMYFESYNANPLLVTQKYKSVNIVGTSPFNRDIRNFLLGTKESAYEIYQRESDFSICDNYEKQFETMYWCGAESINSKQYLQELGFIAPLYIRKKLPNYFVIFKIDGPSNYNLNNDDSGNPIDSDFDIDEDIIKNAKLIKSFDLREGTPIGNYLQKYIEQTDFEFDRSIFVNFSSNEITYYGIDKSYGVLTQKTENFRTELLENDNTIIHSDDWITDGFRRNNLIFPYIINFEFLFDDFDTDEYKFSRYFGLYCNDIDLFEFEGKYEDENIVVDKPEDIIKETIINKKEDENIKIKIDEEVFGYEEDKKSFYYIKDKFNNLHQVDSIDDSNIEIVDKYFDLSSICGFEPITVSAFCEREQKYGNFEFSFIIKNNLKQGETISFLKDGEVFKTFTAITEEDENPIEAGKFLGTKFSAKGTLEDITKSLCNSINSTNGINDLFNAIYNKNVIVLVLLKEENLSIEIDNSAIINNRIILNTNSIGGVNKSIDCTFKVKSDDKDIFTNERYLRTGNENKKNAKILSCVPYIDGEEINFDYYQVCTDENGKYVSISNTNMVEIVDRYYPKFGILSFFPVKDFDFDLIFSTYGSYIPFKEECSLLEKKSKTIIDIEDSDSDTYDRSSIDTLIKGYLTDSEERIIDTEYEYFMENLIPELSTQNKSVPFINKWGYYDDEKDSCENPYRLNMSKIFGTSNLSSNTFTYLYSINEHTHSMPYYITKDRDFLTNVKEYGNYQYVFDSIGLCEKTSSDSDKNEYDLYVENCINLFKNTNIDNFDKLLINKTEDNKRFTRKYSRMKFGDENNFSSTLFRGVKFNIKKIIDEKEIPSIDYNDYKFAFIYIPISLESIYVSNKIYFVKNDTFKFIIGFVVINILNKGFVVKEEGDADEYQTYDDTDFCKSYLYGGCYGLLSLPTSKSQQQEVTIQKMPLFDVFSVDKKENGEIDVKQLKIINQSIKLMVKNLDDKKCIKSIRFYNENKNKNYKQEYITVNSDGIINISNELSSTKINIGDEQMFVDITFNDKQDERGESIMFKDFYSVYESFSTFNIKENINNGEVEYHSTNDDNYVMKIEDPVSFNTYDIFTCTPQVVTESNVSIPSCSKVTLKNDLNNISLKTINRYSGFYNPIFNDVLMFDDYELSDEIYKFSNTKLDTDYEDIYGSFGKIRNLWFHKVNEENSNKIITMLEPLYPAIGQFALDYRDFNIFESNWDDKYFTKQIDLKNETSCAGTSGILNNISMFGSKYLNVPEEITIETFDKIIDWKDELISNPEGSDADIMYKEVNGNTVHFYLFLYKRIIEYFAKETDLRKSFEEYVNPNYSYGDKTTIEDDIEKYIQKNIMKLYYLDEICMWIKRQKVGIHDSKIENDYSTYLLYTNEEKKRKNLQKVNTFSMKKMTNNEFDKYLTYNLRTGEKEDFGFSIKIKKI